MLFDSFGIRITRNFPCEKLTMQNPQSPIRRLGDCGFDFVVDTVRVECLRRWKGFFLLFSSDLVSSLLDVLYFYRAKDADETLFAQVKVELDGEGSDA
jgi:hypothetical protein